MARTSSFGDRRQFTNASFDVTTSGMQQFGGVLLARRDDSNTMKGYIPLAVSLVIHIGLIIYADYVDTHSHRFGGLKYTDVDWRVVTDGAGYIFRTIPGRQAAGWLTRCFDLPIGDPYERVTFRYTPLLPLVLSPALVHNTLGKSTLALLSLLVPIAMRSGPQPSGYWSTHLLWTLNPFVLNITTRGSPEAIVLLLVVITLYCLRKSDSTSGSQQARWEMLAAISWSASISWKIYPVVYGISIWVHLAQRHGAFGAGVWRFGAAALGSFVLLNGTLWSIWGQPFLDHTFLYHLTRQDHRHNFSPYFYPIYLSFFSDSSSPRSDDHHAVSWAQHIARHPLASFVPQFGLVGLAGGLLAGRGGLDLAFFVQTAIFVIFNKVCTSQYFVWFIPLLAPLLPRFKLTRWKTVTLLGVWIVAQAIWLSTAFRLEFLAEAVHLPLWGAGLVLLVASTWVVGELLDAYAAPVQVVEPRYRTRSVTRTKKMA